LAMSGINDGSTENMGGPRIAGKLSGRWENVGILIA
jgi:hypothetical protein